MRYCKCEKSFKNLEELLNHVYNSDSEHYEVKL